MFHRFQPIGGRS